MKLTTNYPIRCSCGQLAGVLEAGAPCTRAVCYCSDCQAYAAALGKASEVLDAKGGTDVVASLQSRFRFIGGTEQLACLSLTERGLLRWYAGCCGTPIANTPRDPKIAYVGFVHTALGDARSQDAAFGPPEIATNVDTARGTVPSSGARMLPVMLRIIARVARARLDGSWRRSPFFDRERRPIVSPRVIGASA